MYHENVMQLRRRIAGLKKQLGYKVQGKESSAAASSIDV